MVSVRKSGILLHPTSLPSEYGIGELGKEAFDFIDFLKRSKQTLWQILPLGPVGFGESPYQSFSAFAGNTLLISIDKLIEQKLLFENEIEFTLDFSDTIVEYEKVKIFKDELFRLAFRRFKTSESYNEEYEDFLKNNLFWLDDYAFFIALKSYFGDAAWNEWDKDIAQRKPEAISYYRTMLEQEIEYHKFLQYVFFQQWLKVKNYANENGISIIGDLPLFISNDSSDAWSKPYLFEIDRDGKPLKVAGVPPDYFSETGQFWGNPHYKWDMMAADDYKWWADRFKVLYSLVDIVRIDHFRGFESYWEIPGDERTAVNGRWIKGPGSEFFIKMNEYLDNPTIIAEDLGFITKEVIDLKEEFGFPGMKILQFTFGKGAEERFLPHNYEENSIVYTGTHDNDTTIGWYKKSLLFQPEAVEQMKDYLKLDDKATGVEFCWSLIETAFKSKSNSAIIPLQDLLCLGTEARMNTPNTIGGNWEWRFSEDMLTHELELKLKYLSIRYSRNI